MHHFKRQNVQFFMTKIKCAKVYLKENPVLNTREIVFVYEYFNN
jgi:hypothetical protein